ncbi:Coiled-coil domain-containing protein, partial [Schistosoma japonicum]
MDNDDSSTNDKSKSIDSEEDELKKSSRNELKEKIIIARPERLRKNAQYTNDLENIANSDKKSIEDDLLCGGIYPAISSVEKLGDEGKLSSVQIAQMKHRFFKLSGLLSKIRDNEFSLLQLSKKWAIELDGLNESLSKADSYPDGYNTKADKLREQLLNANNRLLQIGERNDELNYTIESLKDEKRMLQNEYSRIPKEEDIENSRKQLEKSINEVKIEISKRSGETRQLTQTLKDTKEMLGQITKLKADAEEQCQQLQSENAETQSQPLQIMKETDKLQKQKDEVERLKTETLDEQLKLQDEMKTLESLRSQLELESTKLKNQSNKTQKKLNDLQSQYEAVNMHVHQLEQKNSEMTLQKTELDLKMDHLKQELLQLKDRVNHQTHQREMFIHKARKADNILQSLKETVKFTMKTCSEKHMNCLAMKQTGQDKELLKKRTHLIHEIKKLKETLLSQCQLTEIEQTKLRQSLQQIDQMNYDLANLRIELVELTRLVTIKTNEREQKSRDFLIAQSRYTHIQDEVKSKQLQINEYEKSLNSTQLKDFAHLYETIKEERNNCLGSIQVSNQHIQEFSEKLRISTNEIDILQNNLIHKQELLDKQRKKIEESITTRDLLRNEYSKLNCTNEENEAQKERIKQSIERQNTIITQTTKQLESLKDAIGHITKLRNSRAVELVERNEEFCVLQEKLNLQNFTLHKGEIEMNKLNDEIKCLQLMKNDLKRSNELIKKEDKQKEKLQNEILSSQLQ